MTSEQFDFRKPPPSELERHVSVWLTLACRRASTLWPKTLIYPAELSSGLVEAVTAYDALQAFPPETVGILLTPAASTTGVMMLAIRRPLLLALIGGILGDTPESVPVDRDPTDLEAALVGHIVRDLFIEPLEKGWPAVEPIHLSAGTPGSPRTAWPGQSTEMVLRAALTVKGPFGEEQAHLVLTKAGRWRDLADSGLPPPLVDQNSRAEIEAIVNDMNVDLEVVLGTAELTMSAVSRLKAGDLVVLRQKVADPLDGLVSGSKKFRVWPGAVGTRAAVQIHTPSEG